MFASCPLPPEVKDDYEEGQYFGEPPISKVVFKYDDIVQATDKMLVAQGLFRLCTQNWVLFMKKDFDCFVNGEPYLALSFLLHLDTGQFMSRVWNRTVTAGFLKNVKGIEYRLKSFFGGKVPCIGLISESGNSEKIEVTDSYIVSCMPFKRKISIDCQFLGNKTEGGEWLCEPCFAMKSIDSINFLSLIHI